MASLEPDAQTCHHTMIGALTPQAEGRGASRQIRAPKPACEPARKTVSTPVIWPRVAERLLARANRGTLASVQLAAATAVLGALLGTAACAHPSSDAEAREALLSERGERDGGAGTTRGDAGSMLGDETNPDGADAQSVATLTSPPRERPPGTIFRDEIERATHNGKPAYLLRQLALSAVRDQGRFLGWRIGELWPDDPAVCRDGCDLRTGDIVLKVNGQRLEQPDAVDKLMALIPKATQLEVELIRDGEIVRKSWAVVDAPPDSAP